MSLRSAAASTAALAAVALLSAFQSPAKPEQELAKVVASYLTMGLPADWDVVDKLPSFTWAGPVASLRNCLPDGGCFARQGAATLGGNKLAVMATGARTMVLNIYLRNTAKALGGPAVIAALQDAGVSADLARCPVREGAAGTSWYKLSGKDMAPAYLSIQPPTAQRPTEGFVISYGEDLPRLQPNQLALYSEKCGAGAERAPVSTVKPVDGLAETVVALLMPAAGPALPDWKGLAAMSAAITWDTAGPRRADRTALGDPNPMMLSGKVTLGGRTFSLAATGTAANPKTIFFDEQGMHPRGEHMLGVVYQKGIAVKLVRCGPVYTESTNNWYSLESAKTRTAMIRQSIRYDGNQVQDAYELRLDGTLPTRDPRDRNPGQNGC